MRTQGAFFADTPHNGGWIVFNALDTWPTGGTINRVAAGEYTVHYTTATTTIYIPASLSAIKRLQVYPSVNGLPFQEEFSGYPAGAAGIPPFTGATQLVQPTVPPPKGVMVTDIAVAYSLAANALSAHTVAAYRNTFVNNSTITQSVILAPTALGTAITTNVHVVTTPIASPAFEVNDLSDFTIEVVVTPTASAPTYDLYWIGMHCQFNYN